MPVAENDGVGIAYEVTGSEHDETVVFLNGLGYGRWFWQWQRPAVEDGYRIIMPDNRGVGESDTPEGPYTIPEMASDIEAVLADADIESAHVLGVSMGGMIAQQYALDYDRTESLILMATTCGGPDRTNASEEVMDRILNPPPELDQRENIRYKMKPAFTDEFWEREGETVEEIIDYRTAAPVPDEVRNWQAAGVASWGVCDELPQIAKPTLIMHGERDQVVPVENLDLLTDGLSHAEVARFDDGGSHLFMVERSQAVNEQIRQFLDKQ